MTRDRAAALVPVGDQFLELAPKAAAERHAGAISKHDKIIAVLRGLHFHNLVYVHEGGPADPCKSRRTEPLLKRGERLAYQQAPFACEMHGGIIVGCLNPDDVLGPDEYEPPVDLDGHALSVALGCTGEHCLQTVPKVARAPLLNLLDHAPERQTKALPTERFQQVVDGLLGKGIHGEALVGRRDDNGRSLPGRQRGQKLEAVAPGHLHVQKHDVWPLPAYRRQRLDAIAVFTGDFDGRIFSQKGSNAFSREGLVVDDERAHLRRDRGASGRVHWGHAGAPKRNGNGSVAFSPQLEAKRHSLGAKRDVALWGVHSPQNALVVNDPFSLIRSRMLPFPESRVRTGPDL
jgi:hypothetical protein